MPYLLATLLLCLVVAVVVALASRQRVVFTIRLDGGKAVEVTGDVDEAFVKDVQRICALFGVGSGEVRGVATPRGLRIDCRGEAQQQQRAFQNAVDHPI